MRPYKVSEQITDAVTQANVEVVGMAPATAMGTLYQTLSHSAGIMFENSTTSQGQQNILGQTATTQGIMQIYSMDTVADSIAISKLLKG